MAAFDGALMHVLNEGAPGWMQTKGRLLATDRQALCANHDVLFLQEASTLLRAELGKSMQSHHVFGGARGQDSLLLLKKDRFADIQEMTDSYVKGPYDLKIENGDAVVVEAAVDGHKFVLGSFHGDSDGQQTVPFIKTFTEQAGDAKCILGIDAQCVPVPSDGKLTHGDFLKALEASNLKSCFGEDKIWTTFKARTFVQPQFQKAVLSADLHTKADMAPKDHVLCSGSFFKYADVQRDTTGTRAFVDAPLPNEHFPSDHAIVAAEVDLA